MSLDIYLYGEDICHTCVCEACGSERIEMHPIKIDHFHITHNLTPMADAVGLYECVWRPEEHGIEFAHQMIPFLKAGVSSLNADPIHYKLLTPKNGYGSYESFLKTLTEYLIACEINPNARIEVCR
jgi:hypothetical protein